MTEQTLFEMDAPRAEAEEAKAKKPKRSAGWFPQNNGEMLMRGYEPSSGPLARCRGCNAEIEWWTTPTGRRLPMNPMPTPQTPAIAHWSTCTNPEKFRKAKKA
jgi:hypothetical protein